MSVTPWQRRLLAFGAVFDLAFAVPMLLFAEPASRLLRIPLPEDLTWFRLSGVLLLILAGCYAVGAHAPEAIAHQVGFVAGAGRLLGCLLLVQGGWGGPVAVLGTGILDGVLGLLHVALAATWMRSRPASPA